MEIFSLFKGLGSKKAGPAGGAVGDWVPLNGNHGGINDRNLLAANKEWVAIAVDKVATAVAAVPFKVLRYTRDSDDQEVFDGPLVKFLERPAPNFTGKDFIYLNTIYKELTGNAFWEKKGSVLDPLIPTSITPKVDNTGHLDGYRYTAGGKERHIPLKDVLHDRYVDPARPYWGVGKLSKIAKWVDVSTISSELLNTLFANGGVFGGFIETEEDNEQRINLIKASMVNDHTGARKWFKWGVLPKGAKANSNVPKLSDLEMGATDDRYRDKILSAFGVPKTLIGLTTEVNRASAEASEYIFARYTVQPAVEDLVAFLNIHIAPMLDPTGKTYFAFDEFVPTNMELELKEREIALNKQPYKTVNEVRAEVGLPPISGGDTIYGSALQVPLGQPQAAPNVPVDDDDDDDTPPPAKRLSRALPAHVRKTVAKERGIDRLVDNIVEKLAEVEETRDLDAEAHKSFVARVEAFMLMLETRIREFNSRQGSQVIQDLTSITKAVSKTDVFDAPTEVQLMVDVVTPLLAGLLTEEAIREFEAQGFPGTFDNTDENVRKIVADAAKRLATSYNNTTADLLAKSINEGMAAGETLAELTKRVQEVYQYSDIVRAKATAHTESFYMANKANQEAYRQSGVVVTQRWYTSESERVCEFCRPLHGRIIGVDEDYFKKGDSFVGDNGKVLKLDYRAIDVPPLHVNCQCFIRPEKIEIGE